MKIYGEYITSVRRALSEIDLHWENYKGLIVAGTHNPKSLEIDLLLKEIEYARINKIPSLFICFGHQLAAIEYARNVLNIKDATSEEFGEGTLVVKKRPNLKVGLHDSESWWSNYDVCIDWKISENFISVPFHPEYQSSKDKPHPVLKEFINACKKTTLKDGF